ncbi:ribosome small subunit-dependent GTPase A [Pseudorhodobacter turbinis]|uniref:ribosome small subunit-dependent GTPase A n=1 Tax=Pseudorhodobacter turbinis TaxID=2500533 RepID=UPI001F0E5711|nr:ribosome small subunit-dependent GTPase A [Pseudorhodobacter turbinis]
MSCPASHPIRGLRAAANGTHIIPSDSIDIPTLKTLGWDAYFADQLTEEDLAHVPARVAQVHRDRLGVLTEGGPCEVALPNGHPSGSFAVGDWVLISASQSVMQRRLERRSLLQRRVHSRAGSRNIGEYRLIGANIDTLFITTSCNADFNVARLERYLTLAHDAGVEPVILLTKADMAEDPVAYLAQAQALGADLAVLLLDAHAPDVPELLAKWTGEGQTVALSGSSGVGKTTLTNALTGMSVATQEIREDDARGRHTTTARHLYSLPTGGWLIDTPGIRGLGVSDAATGIEVTFAEITALAAQCKFRDCLHEREPGCAVQAAIVAGEVDPERLARWRKLSAEDTANTASSGAAMGKGYGITKRSKGRALAKQIKTAQKHKKR